MFKQENGRKAIFYLQRMNNLSNQLFLLWYNQ